jgi:hypothetical protein
MPFEIQLQHAPHGYATTSADPHEEVSVMVSGYFTDEHGLDFYRILDSFTSMFLRPYIENGNHVSTLDHCLVLIEKDGKTKVFLNELGIVVTTIAKKDMNLGEPISKNDIGGIQELSFDGIPIPENNGLAFYFSIGWRRGFFFDFRPLGSNAKLENVNRRLGQYYEGLLFKEYYVVDDQIWQKVYAEGWFPFISVIGDDFTRLITRIKEAKPIALTETTIIDSFDQARITKLLEKFRKLQFLEAHISIIEVGIERYLTNDFISSIAIIWPRIEGILVEFTNKTKRLSQQKLVDNMKGILVDSHISPTLFFPEQFRDYLLSYYYRDFDFKTSDYTLSRHSIAHGVSDSQDYDQKRALLGILMI